MKDKKRPANAMSGKRGQEPADPNLTLEVKNPAVEEQMKAYASEKTGERLNQLLTALRTARLLVPAILNDRKQPVPCTLKASTGEILFPAYTCREQIPKEPKSPVIINMPFLAINRMVAKPGTNAVGIVVNPFTDNLVFRQPLVRRIEEVERQRKNGVQKKTVQLTPAQYALFERGQFELGFLPKRFFEQKKELIDALCERREEYIDELFEESYRQKRLYPYLPEEFSVMVMNISEELLLVRVDLPNRDLGESSCERVYLAWNGEEERGRYFTIARTKEKGVRLLGEILEGGKRTGYGEAPVEGAELQRIIDLVKGG